ncbi:hypothetical protein ACHAPE_009201 [Trichoderma viride]
METNSTIQTSLCIWTCHKCLRRYAIGTTQRCIDCGHRNCHSEKATVVDHCIVQSDSSGWRRIYSARRSRLLQQQSSPSDEEPMIAVDREASGQQESGRLEKMPNGTSSCFTDCASPGDCFSTTASTRTAKRANRSSSSSSSSEPSSKKPMKKPRNMSARHKRRHRRNFKKTPSPLSQEWCIDDVLDEEADDDAVIIGGGERVGVVEGKEEASGEVVRTTKDWGPGERGDPA